MLSVGTGSEGRKPAGRPKGVKDSKPRKPYPRAALDPRRKYEALADAEQMLTIRVSRSQVVKALVKAHTLSVPMAERLVAEAEQRIGQAIRDMAPEKRERLIASYNALFAKAMAGNNLIMCREVLRDLATLEGLVPIPGRTGAVPGLPAEVGQNPYAERSDAELEFFTAHARWPDAAELAKLEAGENRPAVVDSSSARVQNALPADVVVAEGNGRRAFPA